MKVKYLDITKDEWVTTNAQITTNSSFSSYGAPIILVEDREAKKYVPIDTVAWVWLQYSVIDATDAEQKLFNKWLENNKFFLENDNQIKTKEAL